MAETKKLIPKRRFKEFQNAGEWEQRKFGEMSISFEYGLNAAAKDFDGMNKYIRITDINDSSRDFSMNDLTSPNIDLNSAENYKLQYGDILFARTGASVGKSYIYKVSDGLVYYAGFLIRARIKKEYNPYFIFYTTLTNKYDKYIRITSQRSGQPGVNAQEYAEFDIIVPEIREQVKISEFLKNLDNLITIQQRKLEKIKSMKKAYLHEMFPAKGESKPKRRFNGFADDWKLCKIGEIGTVQTCKRIFKEQTNISGDIPFYKNGTLGLLADSYISKDVFEEFKKLYPFPEIGDILMSVVGSIGRTAEYKGDDEYFQDSNIVWLKTNKSKINRKFLKISYQIIDWIIEGSTIKHLYNDNILLSKIWLPSISEQEKIGIFFENLDNLITLHQSKLDKLKNLKKAYLNEMFI